MNLLRSSYALLLLAIVFVAVCLLFSITPLWWDIEGRPNESYPELIWSLEVLPASLLILTAAIVLVIWAQNREKRRRQYRASGVTLLLSPDYVRLICHQPTVVK